jgi:Fe-S-cluster containining protein
MNLRDLYSKIEAFEKSISAETLSQSSCREGCSQCCYTDLSVFEIEASHIREWFSSLTDDQKKELLLKWNNPVKDKACHFLQEEKCTVYEARPLICRSQGLAFKFQENNQTFLDICPLNENMLNSLSDNEVVNLDLLNTMLSRLEKLNAGSIVRERIKLSDLRTELWTQLQEL